MKLKDDPSKEQLLNRLRRIEGQVRGVQIMVSEERECREILQQLSAIRAAVQSTALVFVQSYVSDCILNQLEQDQEQRKQMVDDLVNLVGKSL